MTASKKAIENKTAQKASKKAIKDYSMTAKQIAEKTEKHVRPNQNEFAELIKDYAKQKCKEQREIIAEDCFAKRSFSVKLQKIVLNAPKPKFN